MGIFKKRKQKTFLYPDEIFIDAGNLPDFDTQQFEGVMEKPINARIVIIIGIIIALIMLVFIGKSFSLQYLRYSEFEGKSANNSLRHSTIFPERGIIYDRTLEELAWNGLESREYITRPGFGHTLGYVGYPVQKEIDEEGYDSKEFIGRDGSEQLFNEVLHGRSGLKIVEIDVSGEVTSESVLTEPEAGENVVLSIDQRIQEKFYNTIKELAIQQGFSGGSGIIMDIKTGEVLSMVNYPEYNSTVLSRALDEDQIEAYREDKNKPFLNRSVQGLYTPGSIFKPFVAIGALNEGIIDSDKIIMTEGFLSVPNPYEPDKETIFRDWKNHGDVDMESAIANSSNVYFFRLGGGYETQPGLGIERIEKYAKMFGFGRKTGIGFDKEEEGFIPTPEWKEKTQNDIWRIGDTYNTSIGQYNFQATPIQVVRAISAIASGGRIVEPTLVMGQGGSAMQIDIPKQHFIEVKKGMRSAVLGGTAAGLNISGVEVAAKTGTAEIDSAKKYVNSWVTGFFPYNNPRYSFVVVMERGPRGNFIGGVYAMRQMLEWIRDNTPEYINTPD